MLTLLTKNYNKDRYAWLNKILAIGIGTATGKRGCHLNSPGCKACDNRAVCKDILHLLRFLGGEIHSTETNGDAYNVSNRI